MMDLMLRALPLVFLLASTLTGQARVVRVAGETFKIVLLADGSVMGWGDGRDGQLGPAVTSYSSPPVTIALPGKAIDIAAGEATAYALLESGAVLAWGRGRNGELGTGQPAVASSPTPVAVAGVAGAVRIDAYGKAAFAVTRDGAVMAWGGRKWGMIGDGQHPKRYLEDGQPAYSPVRVPGLAKIARVSAGPGHVLALSEDGRVYSWGSNTHGALGRAPRQELPMDLPGEVPGLAGVAAIAAGNGVSTVLKRDGTVWVWGANWFGQFGNGERTDPPGTESGWELAPRPVKGIAGATAISVGQTGRHTLVLMKDGTVRGWGGSDWGQVGAGVLGDYNLRPAALKLPGVRDVFAVGRSGFAVTADGALWEWGAGGRYEWPFKKDTGVPAKVELPGK